MAYIILDVCPKCKTDVSRRLGFITTPSITCSKCGHSMYVTESAVLNNWQYNVAVGAWMLAWAVFVIVLWASPEAAMSASRFFGMRVLDTEHLIYMSVLAFIPAAFVGLPFGLVGRMCGYLVWQGFTQPTPSDVARAGRPMMPADAPQMQGHGLLFRAFFGMVWFAAFFLGGVLLASVIATNLAAGNQKLIKQYNEQVARDWTGWVLLGSLVLAVGLTAWGVLPGTAKLREATDQDRPDVPPEAQRGYLIRSLFGCGWFVALFFGSVFALAVWVTMVGQEDPRRGKQLSDQMGKEWTGWIFLGSLGLVFLLTVLGVLPGTGKRKR